ncbi:MAG: methyltransferase domain-containing protein [Phenylobacterium sp.]|uniref:class I SAM-dependent methyltransferase n=1 Tax=Phenylobacterium sp. TaxID=1871053 RepID=UPI00122739D3|nr:class I SAM-dependent methyltransferase [Phenylobacterium sp.]TAJ70616.1 MAG: methyltransferase domain-containing protein [Phenylobacterium sp.]
MSESKAEALRELVSAYPATTAIIETVLKVWPEHAAYLLKSFAPRTPAMLKATEAAAAASAKLMAGQEETVAADYRWTCDRLRDEELFFHREGRYRLSTFAEANAEVYSDHAYMGRYVNGLLLTQVLWYNHVATFTMFLDDVLGGAKAPFDYLEVGPGHGLMVYFAAQSPLCQTLQAWDVSAVSLRETRAALDKLGLTKPVALVETDILAAERPKAKFDLIVISEVLEHLETPDRALSFLRDALKDDGRIFINVPLNSPSPDHIYLFETPDDVKALVEGAGLKIETLSLFATQGRSIDSALANRISVSAGVVGRPA